MQKPTEEETKRHEIETHIEMQARIILSELRAARELAQKLGHDCKDLTNAYLKMLCDHYNSALLNTSVKD